MTAKRIPPTAYLVPPLRPGQPRDMAIKPPPLSPPVRLPVVPPPLLPPVRGPVCGMLAGVEPPMPARRPNSPCCAGEAHGAETPLPTGPACGWINPMLLLSQFGAPTEPPPPTARVRGPRLVSPIDLRDRVRSIPVSPGPDGPDPPFPPPTHKPVYPKRNINMPLRKRAEPTIVIRVNSVPTSFPSPLRFAQLGTAIDALAKANAYQSASHLPNFGVSFKARPGPVPTYDVTIEATGGLKGNVDQALKVIAAFEQAWPGILRGYDHVVMFYTGTGAPNALGKFIWFPQSFTNGLTIDQIAAGVFHEMGHGYNLAHANAILEWGAAVTPNGVDYGDTFDFMGGVANNLWRFKAACAPKCEPKCAPTGQCTTSTPNCPLPYATATGAKIHINPIHKLHHGWLDDTSIIKVTKLSATPLRVTLQGITSSTGKRAVMVDRSVIKNANGDTPQSILIYFRDNENGPSGWAPANGASIAIVSQQNTLDATRLIERAPGPQSCPAINQAPPGYDRFPGYYATLLPGEEWVDDDKNGPLLQLDYLLPSYLKIKCVSASTTAGLVVELSLDPRATQLPPEHRHFPILDVISPVIETYPVVRKGDRIVIEVDATDPDWGYTGPITELRKGWQNIARVTGFFSIGGENSPLRKLVDPSSVEIRPTWLNGTEVWEMAAGNLRDPDPNLGPVVHDMVTLSLTATTTGAARAPAVAGIRRFFLDNR